MSNIYWQDEPVTLSFSKRKTMALHVRENGIEIRAPNRTPLALIDEFLQSHHQWIGRKRQEIQQRESEKFDFLAAKHIPFMGLNVRLNICENQQKSWQLVPEGLKCTLKNRNTELIPLLADFYQKQARFWLEKKTLAVAKQYDLDSKLSGIRLRKTKTKWGHCSSQGEIQYNWLIMMAPETIIDYLVAHEVSHLAHLNHSSAFWQQVETIQPGYNEHRRWLKDNGHRLTLD